MVKYDYLASSSVLKGTMSKTINPAAGICDILHLYGMLAMLICNVLFMDYLETEGFRWNCVYVLAIQFDPTVPLQQTIICSVTPLIKSIKHVSNSSEE